MALLAQREASALGAKEDDVLSAHEPFQVRVNGNPTRLLHSTAAPVVGWASTALGDVFLVLVGKDDAALVLLTESDEGMEGGDLRVVRRGPPFGINDVEISPGFGPLAHPYGRIHATPEFCAHSINGMTSASEIVRQEGVRLVRAAVGAQGMRFARLVLRSIFVLHEAGRRSCSAGRLVDVLGDFVGAGLIDKLPSGSTYRPAMQWLADEIGIVERLDTTRWAVHYEEIATPSDRLSAEIRDAQRRASIGAE